MADVLFGDANPAGHLPVSWPRSAGQIPLYYNHNLTQLPEPNPEFKSRYWDLLSTPLYPFGYGLCYTTFAFDNLKLSPTGTAVGGTIEVSADVTNTGQREGTAVAQLYIHQRAGSASRPVRQLKGFERVTLAPGAKQTVHFKLGSNELQFYSPMLKQWLVDPEQFDVWLGGDSTAKLHGEFELTKELGEVCNGKFSLSIRRRTCFWFTFQPWRTSSACTVHADLLAVTVPRVVRRSGAAIGGDSRGDTLRSVFLCFVSVCSKL